MNMWLKSRIVRNFKYTHYNFLFICMYSQFTSDCITAYSTCSVTGRTIQFNMAKMLPDVVLETNIGPSSMSVLPPGVGFR